MNVNPYRYRSYYYDSETGMYYLNSRYYSPEWGRFINADGIVETGTSILGNNMYLYSNNNPVNLVDPDGDSPFGSAAAQLIFNQPLVPPLPINTKKDPLVNFVSSAIGGGINYIASTPQRIGNTVNSIIENPIGTLGSMMLGGLFVTTPEYSKIYNISKNILDGNSNAAGQLYGENLGKATMCIAVYSAGYFAHNAVTTGKIFSANNGYGFQLGKFEMLYENPSFIENYGKPGGTFISYGKYRIDWDPARGYHSHPPGHK